MANVDEVPGGGDDPFGGGPFGGDDDGGLLDDLRASGEEVVNQEIAGLQAAMERVESFGATLADADIDALRNEWQQIETEIKRALQSGLSAVEERTTARHPATFDDEVKSLETEVARKNELITQLSDSVKKLNRELDEKDRKLREDLRALRDRTAQQEEEMTSLRARATELDHGQGRMRAELEAATAERDQLRVSAAQVTDALASEKTHQEERYAALEAELNETRLASSKLENEKREADRRAADFERRLAAAEKAREKAEQERNDRAQEATKASKEARTLSDRVAALDAEVTSQRERIDNDLRRLRRLESRLRADGESTRSRISEAVDSLRSVTEVLSSIPRELPTDDEPAPEESPTA